MTVLYVVTTNSAIEAEFNGLRLWRGSKTLDPGFYLWSNNYVSYQLYYVDKLSTVYTPVNYLLPQELDYEPFNLLFRSPGWQCDPATGNRIVYRVVDPVEYVFMY